MIHNHCDECRARDVDTFLADKVMFAQTIDHPCKVKLQKHVT